MLLLKASCEVAQESHQHLDQVEAVEAGLENGGNMLEAVTSLTNLTTRWIHRVNDNGNDTYYDLLSVSAVPGDPWRRVSAA